MGQVKIAVLGLGESLDSFEGGYDLTIGVNDIWQKVHTDYVVCLDLPERFTPERLATINNCKPLGFYTQLTDWSHREDYIPIELQEQYPTYICQLELKKLPKSMCSPFVACAIAFKCHGANEIHLYGVDLITHPHLKDSSVARIKQHFSTFVEALKPHNCRLVIHGNGALKSLTN